MILARSTCFTLEKQGSTAREWEDAAAWFDGDLATGRRPRFIVVDGATEAYDALRWVQHLVATFTDAAGPAVTRDALHAWFERVQRMWVNEAPTRFANVIEELTFREQGSFATFLGCELVGLEDTAARWEAAALGDTVLFHVRDGRLLAHFPPISVDEFGLSPEGVSTRPAALPQMLDGLVFARGELAPGDLLFLATDALAHWMLGELDRDHAALWALLGDLDHDATFTTLVRDQRARGRLRNDDVTLLRVQLATAEPRALVVCL